MSLPPTVTIGSLLIALNVREKDLIETQRVAGVIDAQVPIIPAGTPLKEGIRIVRGTEAFYSPAVDAANRLVGAITRHGIRDTFATQELHDGLVALDIIEPVVVRSVRKCCPASEKPIVSMTRRAMDGVRRIRWPPGAKYDL